MKTLVVAPHPDDETLGCGGTLLRRKREGGSLAWLIATEMKPTTWSSDSIAQRQKEIDAVTRLVGFDQVFQLGFPAAGLDTVPFADLTAKFGEVIKSFAPTEVLVAHPSDAHTDHRVVFDVTAACTKWFRFPSIKRVLAYETLSETGAGLGVNEAFKPTWFVDISPFVSAKLELLQIYSSELGPFPFPRSPEAVIALARYRGSMAGVEAAEAFQTLRQLE